MKKKKSVLRCVVCGKQIYVDANLIGGAACTCCGVRMQEISKGVITK